MKDVFYLSKYKLLADDIANILTPLGYECTTVSARKDDWLTIRKDDIHMSWDFVDNPDEMPFESEVKEKLNDISPLTFILISYHSNEETILLQMLHEIMLKYSGWVACDDNWNLIFDLNNIRNFRCGT